MIPLTALSRRSSPLAGSVLAATLTIGTLFVAGPAHAVDVSRLEIINPLNACQGALPTFEGSLRKRPRGFINEGTDTAFVSCGFPAEGGVGVNKTTQINVEFRNEGTETQTVSCTAVDTQSPPKFSVKSKTVASGSVGEIAWLAADNGGVNYRYPAVSCALPTGMLIQYVDRFYSENVGQ